jgi:hypothetical protein
MWTKLLLVVWLVPQALSHVAAAQQPGKIWRIGIFHVGLDHTPAALDPLRQQLKVLGYE